DTGAMYRALTLKARNLSVDLSDETALAHLLMQTKIELQFSNETQRILLDGEDVTEEIRNNDVTNHVSFVAQHAEVRKEMVNQIGRASCREREEKPERVGTGEG